MTVKTKIYLSQDAVSGKLLWTR